MTPSWRKPAGMLAILLLIAFWCGLIATFSEGLARLPGWAQLAVYLVTGLIWITPMKPLLRWMETGRWRMPRG